MGEAFHRMCETFNIKLLTTSACSPWSKRVCDRHNQTLTTILLKIKDDVKCDYEIALAWTLSAKNSLPNFIEKNLPAQEPSPK